jgi:glycosyltransferase involved in cell wall biosynthesis
MPPMKIIALTHVKNDAWCIGKAIEHLRVWADEVIVADESSTDGSQDIYRRFKACPNVHIVDNRPKFNFNTPDLRNYMLGLAREFDGNNLIFEIHADEIMSAEILRPEIRQRLLESVRPRSAIMMPWTTLWKHPLEYRADRSIWSRTWSWFGYWDDRSADFEGPYFHGSRIPEKYLANRLDIDFLQVLHYQFVNLGYERSKQALYHIYERNHFPDENIEYINKKYAIAFDERNLKLARLDSRHVQPWIDRGIPLDEEFPEQMFNWRDIEVLRNFERHGIARYRELNIWYIDWEEKRLEAKQQGCEGIPDHPIVDERSPGTRLAHRWLMRTQWYPFWRLAFIRLLFTKGLERLRGRLGGLA